MKLPFLKLAASDKPTKATNEQIGTIVDQIAQRRTFWAKEMDDWVYGRTCFYDDYNPTTWDLQEVYNDIMLDDQVTTVTGDRKLRVVNKKFIIRSKDGKEQDDKSKILQEEWYFNLMDTALDSLFVGYNLPWLKVGRNNYGKVAIRDIETIPRGWVSPKNKLLLENEQIPTSGVEFERFPNELLYAQFSSSAAGLLEKASPLAILKRHSWGSWDEFEQIFGIPLRVAKYALGNDKVKNEIAGWLEQMGSAAYGIFPKETDIDIVENKQRDAYNVFLQKINRADEGISKLVLHQTGSTDQKAYVGAAKVHEDTLDEVTAADERRLLLWLNNKLLPALRHWGYPLADGDYIDIKRTTNPSTQIEIDKEMMKAGYKFKKEYLEETYGVELEEPDPNSQKEPPTDPKKKRLN